VRRTFDVNVCIWVQIGGRGNRIFGARVFVVGINFVTFVVIDGRLALDDGPPHASVVDCLLVGAWSNRWN
jgi:hypothetical protein